MHHLSQVQGHSGLRVCPDAWDQMHMHVKALMKYEIHKGDVQKAKVE